MARLDYYEAPYGFTRGEAEVVCEGDLVKAEIYQPAANVEVPDDDWSLRAWQSRFGELIREAAFEIMDGFGTVKPAQIASRMPVILARSQQRLNARKSRTPVKLRKPHSRDDVTLHTRSRAYSHYFALDDLTVSHKTFEGKKSPQMDRAVFVASDAVTVLPYDPKRDRVLLIEQFRVGCYLREDPNPWSLEAIAGRQDPGESLEDTARREAKEEAGIELGALHRATSYYSSPGATTEYLTTFVGIADLPDGIEGVGGLEEEAEDIRSLLVPFADLIKAVETGEAENAPLILSALWLLANRERLRKEA